MDDAQEFTLPDAADAQALRALIPDLVTDCPDLYAMAYQIAQDILLRHNISDEPDKVYWHRFRAAQSSSKTFTGWEHVSEIPRESMTFPQLVIQRFSVHDQDNADLLDTDSGFYRADGHAGNYDETNEIRLHARDVLKAFWDINFADRYKTAIATFWEKHSDNFRALAKCTFIAKAIEDYEKGHLTQEHFTTVLRAVVGNITRPLTRQMLLDEASAGSGLSIRTFCIDHFVSTDILSITDGSDLNILYVPGGPRGFYCFNKVEELHEWLVNEVKDAEGRERMLMHFKQEERDILQERPTSLGHKLANLTVIGLIFHAFEETPIDNVGLNHAYDVLPGEYAIADHHLLHYRGERIAGDAFTYLNRSTHERMLSDANFLLHSNGELRKKLWIGYLNAFNHTFGPMAALAWPAALVVIGAGIASVGLHIDQAINGTTQTERKAAVIAAIFDSVNVLFNLPFLRGATELADAAETEEALASGKAPKTEIETPATPSLSVDADATGPSDSDILAPFETNEVLDGDLPTSDEGKYQGIYRPATGGHYIAIDDLFYQVRYSNELRCWAIIDPINPYSFFRNIPVRLNELGEWTALTRTGLAGGGKFADLFARAEPALPDFDAPPTAYDIPEASRADLNDIAQGGGSKYDLKDYIASMPKPDGSNPNAVFKAMRKTLYGDATAFFESTTLPARPEIPALPSSLDNPDIVKKLLRYADSIVIGENHSCVASKQFLIENMAALSKQNVKTLYLEHLLTDFHQADLDAFNKTGTLSKSLEDYLKDLDIGHRTDPSGRFNFQALVKAARESRIRVQAIDCLASYKSTGMEGVDRTYRQKMMNFFAHEVIRSDQALRGAHRWVALVGDSHANTWEGVPGLSELESSIGLRIESAPAGTSRGIEVDPGRIPTDNFARPLPALKSDLRLRLVTSQSVEPVRTVETELRRPGDYTVLNRDDSALLVHRSSDRSIVRTPIQRDAGSYYIERPSWASISGRRYSSLVELEAALKLIGLRPVQVTTS